jgi:alkylhydroperoxidase family enzyme
MRATVVKAVLRGLSTVQVRHVRAVRYGAADGDVARVYREVERDFGVLAPPVILHAPAPDVMSACWLTLRETLLVPGNASRAAKEAVCTAISESNACPFCITMHSSMLTNLVGYRDGVIDDQDARAAAEWTGAGPAPFPAAQTPEMVGTAVVMQYLNRMVNIFLGEVPLPPRTPEAALVVVRRVLVWLIKTAERGGPVPGASLDLLPEAPLPADLGWAADSPAIAGAFARAAATVDEAGRRSVPPAVRELLAERLSAWDGRKPGLGRGWVDDAVAGLPATARPAGRLALLTAFASYQIDQAVLDEFRATGAADRALIDLTAWASFTTARRMGSWLRIPGGTTDFSAGSSVA